MSSMPAKSSPMDVLPTSLLKSRVDTFAPLIARLTRLSGDEGRFSSKFKTASVTSVLKRLELDRDSPANYRPISNLTTISKILQRLIFRRIQPHVNSSENFNTFLSVYRRHQTTETALVKILDDIYQAAGTQGVVIRAALDISAAF